MPKNTENAPFEDDDVVQSVEELMGPEPNSRTAQPTQTAPLLEAEKNSEDVAVSTKAGNEPIESGVHAEEIAQANESPANESPDVDKKLDEAVKDISVKDSDRLLLAEDEKLAEAFAVKKPDLNDKIKHFFVAWWQNKKARWASIILSLVLILLAIIAPTSRYFLLNSVGVRSSASMVVLDDSTRQPLRNVRVAIGEQIGQTDQNGYVRLSGLRLGKTELVIERRAFAVIKRNLVLGWGSNPLGEFDLTPVGAQYTFRVTDFMTGKPIDKAEAVSGESSAFVDQDGKVVLTVEEPMGEEIEVTIKAAAYRSEEFSISADEKTERVVQMVPSRKHVFISKRSGKFDVYKIDVDGKNEEILLKGTGSERDDMVLVPHPSVGIIALVSTRNNVRNEDSFLLSNLTLIDVQTGTTTDIVQSERIQIVDWVGDRLVYVQVAAGASAESASRHRLTSYDYIKEVKVELASSNYFNDVLAASGNVYYAPSRSSTNQNAGLFRIAANGNGKQTILDKEVWNIFRDSYDVLTISAAQEWYSYELGDDKASRLSGPPAQAVTHLFADNSIGQKSLWVEERDGKGTLLVYDLDKKSDEVIHSQSGLRQPAYWLNDKYAVYRIYTDQESADYLLNINGGSPRKIQDVTNTGGLDKWYFY